MLVSEEENLTFLEKTATICYASVHKICIYT